MKRLISFGFLLSMVFLLAFSSKEPERPKKPKKVNVLIMFKSSANREKILKDPKPKYNLTKVQNLGEKMATLELPEKVTFAKFKSWMESQPGVIYVEKNDNLGRIHTK